MSAEWGEVVLPVGWRLEVRAEAGSTNDEIRLRAAEAPGLVVLAERQWAGRGRRGAAWLSEAGKSLTFSVLLKPREPKALWPRLSLAAGLAVAEALGRFGLEAEIKWPNDVMAGGRKLCGILVEAAPEAAIVGIGLNVGTRDFPAELAITATSLSRELGRDVPRADVLGEVLRGLDGWSREIGTGFGGLIRRVRERCFLSGKRVRLTAADGPCEGVVREVGDGGELVVDAAGSVRRFLQADEVRAIG